MQAAGERIGALPAAGGGHEGLGFLRRSDNGKTLDPPVISPRLSVSLSLSAPLLQFLLLMPQGNATPNWAEATRRIRLLPG